MISLVNTKCIKRYIIDLGNFLKDAQIRYCKDRLT